MAELSRLPRPIADEWEWQYQGACRTHALAVHEPYGIWGGLSEDDRLAIIGKDVEPKISHAS